MAKKKLVASTIDEKLDILIRISQDRLILQALLAGVNSHAVAAMVKIDKRRVSNISKNLKHPKK